MAGVITTKFRNILLDRGYNGGTYSYVNSYQLGMSSKTPAITDTELYAPIPITTTNRATIDDCDATTGWSTSGDADSVVLDTTSGNRLEGTGALDLRATHSTGTATYYKTVTGFDGSTDYMFWAFYINDLSQFTNTTDTISIDLGTGGFTDYNTYDFAYSQLQTGWNAIVCDVDNADSTSGSGATTTNIDRVRANLKITGDLADDDVIMDWLHTYPVADTFDTFNTGYPTFSEAAVTSTVRGSINSAEANGGYIIREFGLYDSTLTYLASRDTMTTISKSDSISVTFEQKDKITN